MKITVKEAKYLRHTISLLSSMINSGEEHSGISQDRVTKSLGMLTEKPLVSGAGDDDTGWGF